MTGLNGKTNFRHYQHRYLIVEDNHFAAELLVAFFRKIGIECDCADSGETGLALYQKNFEAYTVILTDLQMPVMDGFEMARQIRESGLPTAARIPIIAMSGTVEHLNADNCFNYFLRKPFELQSLPGIIADTLRKNTESEIILVEQLV